MLVSSFSSMVSMYDGGIPFLRSISRVSFVPGKRWSPDQRTPACASCQYVCTSGSVGRARRRIGMRRTITVEEEDLVALSVYLYFVYFKIYYLVIRKAWCDSHRTCRGIPGCPQRRRSNSGVYASTRGIPRRERKLPCWLSMVFSLCRKE